MKVLLLSFIISLLAALVIAKPVIGKLRKLKMGQTEREEGVSTHLLKQGTPTMGGIIFIIAFILGLIPLIRYNDRILAVMLFSLAFGLIGFIDDYLKVVKKSSDGFKAKQKFACQLIVCFIFIIYLFKMHPDLLYYIRIPFVRDPAYVGFMGPVILFFAVMGTVNAVNFTDGIDGLASNITVIVSGFFLFASMLLGENLEGAAVAMIGALLGFLVFNTHPAKVFMGDTGSLFLGGFVVSMAYMMKMPIYILLVGIIYFVEIVSVMLQVTYFKKTGGKRLFKMTPIHHHFELCGWSEKKINLVFSLITCATCIIAYVGIRI